MHDNRFLPRDRFRAMRFASALLFVCGMLLAFDVGGELHGTLLYPRSVSVIVWAHLLLEVLASVGLGWAFLLTRREMRATLRDHQADRDRLRRIRGEFEHFVQDQFHAWSLSPAERDVALLTIRGLKIAEIADLRQAQTGTVKSQLSAIFRKSGVSTRTEFVARFIDEFLDLSATCGNKTD